MKTQKTNKVMTVENQQIEEKETELSKICAAADVVKEHLSLATLKHIIKNLVESNHANTGLDDADYWACQYFRSKLRSQIEADSYGDSYHFDFIQKINPNSRDDSIASLFEEQCLDFYLAGYIAGAADMDALPK